MASKELSVKWGLMTGKVPYDDVVESDSNGEPQDCEGHQPYVGGDLGRVGGGEGDRGFEAF